MAQEYCYRNRIDIEPPATVVHKLASMGCNTVTAEVIHK